MTFTEIKTSLATAGKPVSDVQLYRYLRKLKLTPTLRQKPQRYRDDADKVILAHLGITTHERPNGITLVMHTTKEALDKKFVTMRQLKRIRADGQKARAAR